MPAILAGSCSDAGVAEWLGTGLQSRLHGFESRHSLASFLECWVRIDPKTCAQCLAAEGRLEWRPCRKGVGRRPVVRGLVSGRDVFDLPREDRPIEMQWLVYQKPAW
jgi:hypothetical protein